MSGTNVIAKVHDVYSLIPAVLMNSLEEAPTFGRGSSLERIENLRGKNGPDNLFY